MTDSPVPPPKWLHYEPVPVEVGREELAALVDAEVADAMRAGVWPSGLDVADAILARYRVEEKQ